jgi:ATP-dependent exoDNAse (exonuclease V) beta subunit
MRVREDVVALLGSGTLLHEVPFSFMLPADRSESPVVLRGAIDCLVLRPDQSIAVVEFKTGRPRPDHQQQLDLYVQAARVLFPGAAVEGHLLYP